MIIHTNARHRFPEPRDYIEGKVVVASAWYSDEPNPRAALLLLHQSAPLYSTAIFDLATGELALVDRLDNIIEASAAYTDLAE